MTIPYGTQESGGWWTWEGGLSKRLRSHDQAYEHFEYATVVTLINRLFVLLVTVRRELPRLPRNFSAIARIGHFTQKSPVMGV